MLYNIVICYFYTFQNDHQHKSSYGISPYKDINHIVIDSIPHSVHFIPMTRLFWKWNFIPLHLLHLFLFFPPTPSSLAAACFFSASLPVFLFSFVCSFVWFFRFNIKVKSQSIFVHLSVNIIGLLWYLGLAFIFKNINI